jgi:hypothetical protein
MTRIAAVFVLTWAKIQSASFTYPDLTPRPVRDMGDVPRTIALLVAVGAAYLLVRRWILLKRRRNSV